jgi:hypothetical protein
MATNNKKLSHTLRCGNIKVTIWQNDSVKGTVLRNDIFAAVQG